MSDEEYHYNNIIDLPYNNEIFNLNNSTPNLNVGALENILDNTPTISSIHHHPSEEISISESLRSFVLKSSETSCNSNNINNITTVK